MSSKNSVLDQATPGHVKVWSVFCWFFVVFLSETVEGLSNYGVK